MNTDLPPSRSKALQLLADYATTKANLDAASTPTIAKITALQSALSTATAEIKARLERLEEEAKQLALEHGIEVFGPERKSLQENGFILAVRPTAAVEIEDDDFAVRQLQDRANAPDVDQQTKVACLACLRIKVEINKPFILQHYDTSPEWFHEFGISVVDKESASLKPAPKPRAAKAKTKTKARPEPEAAAA